MRRALTIAGLLALAAGCAAGTELRPDEDAATLAGPGAAAVGTDAGVRLEVRPSREHPRELPQAITPLFVSIENGSGRGLVVGPRAFSLVSVTGEKHPAVPPPLLRQSEESSVAADIAVTLRAITDEPLGAGGKTDGFLYFDEVDGPGPYTLRFELQAENGAYLGLITVPLQRI